MEGPIQVVVADVEEAFRHRIRSLLIDQTDIHIAAETDTIGSTLASLKTYAPQVVLLDEALADGRDLDSLVHEINRILPGCMIVLLPDRKDPLYDVIETVLNVKTRAQRRQPAPRAETKLAKTTTPFVVAPLRPRSTPPKAAPSSCPLTRRELEVVAFIAKDMSNKEIAHKLGIELQTIKNHVSHILKRLGVRSRGAAALLAREQGWIT